MCRRTAKPISLTLNRALDMKAPGASKRNSLDLELLPMRSHIATAHGPGDRTSIVFHFRLVT